MGLLSKVFKAVRKLSNFLGLGIPDKIDDWLTPDTNIGVEAIKVQRDGSNHNIPVVYGRQKVGGIVVHKYVTDQDGGAKNDTLHLIVVFCEGEIEEIEEVFFNDISENDPKYKDGTQLRWLKINKHTGFTGAPADVDAVANIPNWTADKHKMPNLAYCYIQLIMDKKQEVWRGEPRINAIIRGKKVLDTRTGLIGLSDNPLMCLRDYLTNPIYGKGMPDSRIDEQAFIDGANFCDTIVNVTENLSRSYYDETAKEYVNLPAYSITKQIKRFTCNLIVNTKVQVLDNVRTLLGSFRGILPPDYILSPRVEKESANLDVFTADDIVGGIDYSSGSINDRYNRVIVKFNSKNSNYEVDEAFYPAASDQIYQDWLAEDGGRELEKTFTFDSIDNKAEALQMAEVIAKRSRFGATANINVQARGIKMQVGDVIGVDSYTMGWDAKPFRIKDKTLSPEGDVSFALIEHENSVYPWSGVEYDDREGGTYLGDPSYIDPPINLELTQDPTLATTGELTWDDLVDNRFIDRYRVIITRVIDGVEILSDDTRGRSFTVPLLSIGEYSIAVYSVATLGNVSAPAIIQVILSLPLVPASLDLIVGDFEITAIPRLSGIGLGTEFEFDYAAGDGVGHSPVPVAKGASFTLPGLIPDTLHTIFCRTVNAYGASPWISASATTTATGTQLEPFLGPIQQEIDDANDKIDSLGFADEPLTFQDLMDSVSQGFFGEFDNFQRVEDINDEERIRKQQFEQTSAEIDSVNGNLTAAVTRIDQVEVLADGNASAISILDTRVTSNDGDISANASNIQAVQIDANNNATAINALEARVENNEDFASAQLVLNATYESDIDAVSARAFLGVDINNRVTGINIQGQPANTVIDFIGDKVRFIRPDNLSVAFQWSAADDEFIFDGKIIARDSTFTGTVTASTIQGTTFNGGTINAASFVGGTFDGGTFTGNTFTGATFNAGTVNGAQIITDAGTGIRGEYYDDGTYLIWLGSGAKNDNNGIFWIKRNGTGFIKGEFFAGEIIATVTASASSSSASISDVANSYISAGKVVTITTGGTCKAVYPGNLEGETDLGLRIIVTRNGSNIYNEVLKPVYVNYITSLNETQVEYQHSNLILDNTTATGTRTYGVSSSLVSIPVTPSVSQHTISMSASENKLA